MSRKSDSSVQNNVVSVCCSYLSMVFSYIGNIEYPHGRKDQQQRFKARDLKRQRLRYISQNDRLSLLSLFAFAWSYVWLLISASIKVRTRRE